MGDSALTHRLLSVATTLLVAAAGCRASNQDPGKASGESPLPELKSPPADAALPQLSPEREAFWGRYIGAPGVPGAETLAFCRDAKVNQMIDVAPGVTFEKHAADSCVLFVASPEMIQEVRVVLRRWSEFDEGTFIDAAHQLSASLDKDPASRVSIAWRTYAPLETIVGKDGQLLVGFDVKRVLGKPPLALRGAVSAPFHISVGCTATSCDAEGPSPPGGGPVRIGLSEGTLPNILVTFWSKTNLDGLHALFDATLGPGHQEGPATEHVYHRDGVHYLVRDETSRSVTVIISPE